MFVSVCEAVFGDRKSVQIQISQEGCLNPLLCVASTRRLQVDKRKSVLRQKARSGEEEVRDLITRLKLSGSYLNLLNRFSCFL